VKDGGLWSSATAKPGAANANAAITTKDFNMIRPHPRTVGPIIESTLWRFLLSAKLMFGKFLPAPVFADSKDQPECVGDSRFFQNAARI
jgi:hypothetical protein